jgi:hypothetical protein
MPGWILFTRITSFVLYKMLSDQGRTVVKNSITPVWKLRQPRRFHCGRADGDREHRVSGWRHQPACVSDVLEVKTDFDDRAVDAVILSHNQTDIELMK